MSYALSKYANSALRSNLSDPGKPVNEAFFLDDPESEGNSDSGFTPRRKSSTNSFSSKERNYESVPSALIKASESKGCSG